MPSATNWTGGRPHRGGLRGSAKHGPKVSSGSSSLPYVGEKSCIMKNRKKLGKKAIKYLRKRIKVLRKKMKKLQRFIG